MTPGFTAEAALVMEEMTTGSRRRARPQGGDVRTLYAQQNAMMGEEEAPATTCSCPCCITWKGRLVCC
jgi:hypothetical protein